MSDRKHLGDDAPREDPAEDALGYAPFAEMLAASILAQKSAGGFVYAVHGPWGSGKTTALNFIHHYLQPAIEKNEIYVVRFNPWWFSGQEDLTRAFFDELLSVIGEPLGEQAETAVRQFVSKISGAGAGLKLALNMIPVLKDIPDDYKDAILEGVGIAGGAVKTGKSIFDLKKDIAEALEDKDFRTLVIIDDIDRLTADEQLQIFKLVKSVADLPNVLYLLAFDDGLALQALRARDEFAAESNFLEKIIQAPFDLPTPSTHSLEDWFIEDLNKLIGDKEPADVRRWHITYREIVAPRLATPRAVVKLINAVKAGWEDVKDDVDLTDFIMLQTARLFDKPAYAAIRRHAEWFTGQSSAFEGKKDEKVDAILSAIEEGEARDRATLILSRLFPRFASVTRQTLSLDNADAAGAQKRICAPEHFGTYFRFGVDHETISYGELAEFLGGLGDSDAVAARFSEYAQRKRRRGGTMAFVLLEELRGHGDSLTDEQTEQLLRALLKHGDRLLAFDDLRPHFLQEGADTRVHRLSYQLIGKIPADAREALLRDEMAASASVATCDLALAPLRWDHGRGSSNGQRNTAPGRERVAEAFLDEMQQLVAARISEVAENGEIYNSPLNLRLLFRWAEYASIDAVRDWATRQVADPNGRFQFATLIIGENNSSDRGIYEVIPDGVERFVDLAVFDAQLKEALDAGGLTDDQRTRAERFVGAYAERHRERG